MMKFSNLKTLTLNVVPLLLVMLFTPGIAFSAEIQVQADRNPVGIDESFQLVFKTGDDLDGDPDFSPLEPLLDILNRGQSSNVSIINGRYESSKTWTLTVMPKKRGKLIIPSISFGQDKSPAYEMIVKGAVVRRDEQTEFFTRIEFDRTKLYVQQQLVITQRIFSGTNLSSYELGELSFSGVDALIEPLGNAKQYTKQIGQKPFIVIEKRYAVFPLGSGTMRLEPVVSGAQQGVSRGSFFLPFGAAPKVLRARSRARQIEVLPIPSAANMNPWLPVGKLELSERWSQTPLQFVVGEPVTRTLMLKAEGVTSAQLPELSGDTLDGIKRYPEQPLLNDLKNDSGISGNLVQNVAFIPVRAGQFELPAIEIPWWDTKTETRQIARIPARSIEVSALAAKSPLPTPADPAPTEQTTSGEDSDTSSVSEASIPESVVNHFDPSLWPFLTGVMGLGWLMTILVWVLQNRNSDARSTSRERRERSLNQQFKALDKACRQQDASACRRELLAWAGLVFSEQTINGLGDVICRVPDAMATELRNIDALLYSGKKPDIDFLLIRAMAKQVMADININDKVDHDLLEPLYK